MTGVSFFVLFVIVEWPLQKGGYSTSNLQPVAAGLDSGFSRTECFGVMLFLAQLIRPR